MAAQASMLRFDMNETFRLADKVLDPEGAIEVAAAFQRLGVSAGALADPFALMNQSINDPQGLQNSLADVAKQFTYFDEKTKTFKINPQGVLTLREMQQQTGVSAKEMSKMGLAAAELDARLSDISSAGLSIASEEDKQYLANISTMKDGKYIVTLDDKTEKELAELTQPEFDKLIEEQKKGPKTMEEIAKSQMMISEDISGNVTAIRNAFIGGIITQKDVLKVIEDARGVASTVTGDLSRNLSSPKAVRETLDKSIDDLSSALKDIKAGKKPNEVLSEYLDKLGTQGIKVQEGLRESLLKGLEQSRDKLQKERNDSLINQISGEFLDSMTSGIKSGKVKGTDKGNMPVYSLIEGTKSSSKVKNVVSDNSGGGFYGGGKQSITHDGNVTLNLNFTGDGAKNLTTAQMEQVTKAITNTLRSTDFLQASYNNANPGSPIKAPKNTTI